MKTYWIIFEGILAWIEDQWEMETRKGTDALQICDVKRRKVDTENLVEEVKEIFERSKTYQRRGRDIVVLFG